MTRKYQMAQIDAMSDGYCWYWNDIRQLGEREIPDDTVDSPRKLLQFCRDENLTSSLSKGKLYVAEDHGIIEIRKRNHQPILAFLEN